MGEAILSWRKTFLLKEVSVFLLTMGTSIVTYHGSLRCEIKDSQSGQVLLTDGPAAFSGKGEHSSPTDLLGQSLAACMMTMMGIQAHARGIDLSGMHASVSKTMSAGPRPQITAINIELTIPTPVDEKDRALLIRAAQGCPIHHALAPSVDQEVAYHWKD